MTPQSRFTLFHDIYSPSGTVVPNPLGWDKASISLRRDTTWHSITDYFKGSFVWYGAAEEFLIYIDTTYGAEASVRVLIEITYNGTTFTTLFDGQVDLSMMEELSINGTFYKAVAPVIKSTLWATLLGRKAVSVDLGANKDLSGGTRTVVPPFTLPLTAQRLRTEFKSKAPDYNDPDRIPIEYNFDSSAGLGNGIVALPIIVRDTLQESFLNYPNVQNEPPPPSFVARFRGTYTFTIQIHVSTVPYGIPFGPGDRISFGTIRLVKNGVIHTNATRTDLGTNGVDGRSRYNITATLNLEVGDEISFRYNVIAGVYTIFIVYDNWFPNEFSFIEVTADTLYEGTTTDAYLVKDAFEAVISKLVDADSSVVSTLFDGCNGDNALMQGVHIRGKLMTDRKFFHSLEQLVAGINPIIPIGIGYTDAGKIEIEAIEDFYNPNPTIFVVSTTSLRRRKDLERYYRSIEIGYEKSSSTNAAGLNDPQTKRTYRTNFKNIGKDIKLISTYIASSGAIEETRRERASNNKDFGLDDETFIIKVRDDSGYRPEIGSDFTTVTNMVNSPSAYNLIHSCARMFKRWQNWLQGCVQFQVGGFFTFAGGVGNYLMTSENDGVCEPALAIAENQDIEITSDIVFTPKILSGSFTMLKETYDVLLLNKKNAIGLPFSVGTWKAYHILELDFNIYEGSADFIVLLVNETILDQQFLGTEDGLIFVMEDGTTKFITD